jgi:hypothetical protein
VEKPDWVIDSDWDSVGTMFDDMCRWDEWMIPTYNDHPLLAAILAERNPLTWFDPTGETGAGYLARLAGIETTYVEDAR